MYFLCDRKLYYIYILCKYILKVLFKNYNKLKYKINDK